MKTPSPSTTTTSNTMSRSFGCLRRCHLWLLLLPPLSHAWTTFPIALPTNQQRHGLRRTQCRHRSKHLAATDLSMVDIITFTTSSTVISADSTTAVTSFDPGSINVVVITIFALALAVTAQGLINEMVQGDQGLGAFLRDGSGFQKSAFQPMRQKKELTSDPLPWLKVPQLDFVEVAGQEPTTATTLPPEQQDSLMLGRLQQLQQQMNMKLQEGKELEARIIRNELERLMKENGIEYTRED